MIGKALGMMFQPRKTWQQISEMSDSELKPYIFYPAILALLPAVAWFYGTTQVGWTISGKGPVKFTGDSAGLIAILFYLAQVLAIWAVGFFVHWMSATYGAASTITKGLAIAGLCATPILLSGIIGFVPMFWIDFIVGMLVVSYATYLLYLGIPIVMNIPEERGFLFASAVVAVGLVMAVVVMGATVMLWDMGTTPTFSD
jgi:hypothetical protein